MNIKQEFIKILSSKKKIFIEKCQKIALYDIFILQLKMRERKLIEEGSIDGVD
jgi:hypothetical protein